MAQSSKRSIRDQIPPEARRRARRAGFSADADWYAGRDYKPRNRTVAAPDGPPAHDEALSTARAKHREWRHAQRQARIRYVRTWLQGKATWLPAKVAHFFTSQRPAGHQ